MFQTTNQLVWCKITPMVNPCIAKPPKIAWRDFHLPTNKIKNMSDRPTLVFSIPRCIPVKSLLDQRLLPTLSQFRPENFSRVNSGKLFEGWSLKKNMLGFYSPLTKFKDHPSVILGSWGKLLDPFLEVRGQKVSKLAFLSIASPSDMVIYQL